MLDYVVKQWDENKHLLEEYFKTTEQRVYDSYKVILEQIFKLVVIQKDGTFETWECNVTGKVVEPFAPLNINIKF
jgi:hypothetical protein